MSITFFSEVSCCRAFSYFISSKLNLSSGIFSYVTITRSVSSSACERHPNTIKAQKLQRKSSKTHTSLLLLLLLLFWLNVGSSCYTRFQHIGAGPSYYRISTARRPFTIIPRHSKTKNMAEVESKVTRKLMEDADAYNAIFSSAIDLSGSYVRNNALTVTRSVRDIDSNLRKSFVYHIPVFSSSGDETKPLPPYEHPSTIKYIIPSPSGNKIAKLIEEETPASNKKRQVIEIWTHGGMFLQKRCILSDKNHGKVYTEKSKFGGLSWRPGDEDALVYVAEELAPATKSFFDRPSEEDRDASNNKETASSLRGAQFTGGVGVKEDWGEKYKDVSQPKLFVLFVETGKIASLTNVPGLAKRKQQQQHNETTMEFAFGQPVFSPCGSNVIYTAWDVTPRRLGAIYCFQRPSKIYSSPVEKLLSSLSKSANSVSSHPLDESHPADSHLKDLDYVCITPNDRLARSPRVSLMTKKLAFLCNYEGFDSHNGCMGLDVIDWDMTNAGPLVETRRTIVKPVHTPKKDLAVDVSFFGLPFPGLFLDSLPNDCFSSDGSYIFCDSQWGSVSRVLKISVLDGSIKPIGTDNCTDDYVGGSQSFLGGFKDIVFLFHSSPNNPGCILAVSESREADDSKTMTQHVLTMYPIAVTSFSPVVYPCVAEAVQWRIVNTDPVDGDPNSIIQSILLMPKRTDGTKPPLIVIPHGGPHSCSSSTFVPSTFFLCSQGKYAILLVNYRGSTGFGQGSIEALLGKVGSLDVQDLLHATTTVLDEGEVDESRVGICGGSHGGFLAGHMIGQYPDLFKVAALRNPVTNIATMVTATDISDWCYVEALGAGRYDWSTFRQPLKSELDLMYDKSPVAYLQNVKSPTLVALGMSDQRVPPSQGLEYYYALRSKGVTAKLLVYKDDVHAIDSPASEADHWINIKNWFDDHL